MDMAQERIYFPAGKKRDLNHQDRDALIASWSWWHIGAIAGISGGLLSGLLGMGLTVLMWFTGGEAAQPGVGRLSTWLIVGMILLMMFGAHALDKIDELAKAKEIEDRGQAGVKKSE